MARKARPDCEILKEYGGRAKMYGKAAKRRKSTPNAKAVYRDRKKTTGCVESVTLSCGGIAGLVPL
jgi:hypothetical protein